jgi:hypothetical protein
MSDAYRGEEEAARERLVSLREDLEKREAHLAELDVRGPEQNQVTVNIQQRARVAIPPASLFLFGSFLAFIHGDVVFGIGAILIFGTLLVISSPTALQFFRRLTASLPERVDEFKNPEPIEPATQLRAPVTAEEDAAQKREIEKRRAACIEIEQEIAETAQILEIAENKK